MQTYFNLNYIIQKFASKHLHAFREEDERSPDPRADLMSKLQKAKMYGTKESKSYPCPRCKDQNVLTRREFLRDELCQACQDEPDIPF